MTVNCCIVWSLFYTLASMGLGLGMTRLFKLPSWTTPAVCFNNTTSLPLLLIQSLDTTGILSKLLMSDSDTSSAAVTRAKSYFLVCAMVGNSLTFALGPKLLDGEESPDDEEDEDRKKHPENGVDEDADGGVEGTEDVEQGRIRPTEQPNGHPENEGENEGEEVNEQTSLLPDPIVRHGKAAGQKSYHHGKRFWDRLPPWLQTLLDFCFAFFNAPLIGAIIGAIVGLAPPLHKAFFNTQQEGGIFNAWLTSSVKNIGELFAALQVLVVGVKLSSSMRKMKRGEDSGKVPWTPMIFVLVVRFVIWPV